MNILYVVVTCLMTITPKVTTALTVNINENKTGIVGEYELEINCSFTKENVFRIFSIGLFGKEVTQLDFIPLVSFLPTDEARLTATGEYLRGRVMLTNLTQKSTYIKMTFTKLECIDAKEYRCKVAYQQQIPETSATKWSLSTSIKLTVRPSKPEMVFTTHPFSNTSNRLDNETNSVTEEKIEDMYKTTFMEGDNITFFCTGNVGKPEGIFLWQKIYYSGQIFNYSHVSTESLSESCSFNGTSNLTIQMTANDNKAKMRCIVQSEISGVSVYTESEPLQIYFKVREPSILVEPNISVFYKTGESVQLNCKADGNPNPHYSWFKGNISDTFITDNDTLVIKNANISDSGVYTCDTSNEINGEIFSEFRSRKVRIVKDPSTVDINPNIRKPENSNGVMLKCSFNISVEASFHSIALSAQNKTTGEFKDVVGTYKDGKSISTAFGIFLFGNITTAVKHNNVFMLTFDKLTFRHERLYKCILVVSPLDDLFNTNPIESGVMQITVTADDSKTPSSGRSPSYLGAVIGCVAGVVVFIIVILIVIVYLRKKRKSKSPTSKNDSKPKPVPETRTGDYDYIALKDDAPKRKSSNNGLEVEDITKHNAEYLKKQEEEEKKKNESNTPPQPAVYAQVNEATQSKNKPKTESTESTDKQEEDPYAETQEDVYDKAGNSRHKVNENVEHFDSLRLSKQNSNGDNKLSIQTSQVGSYANQGFEKDENRKVATVSPTVRSSSGSQNDEQTNSNRNGQSKKGYENIIGTYQTCILEEETSHRTAL